MSPKHLAGFDRKTVYKAVLKHYQRPNEALARSGDRDWARAMAAYLARRFTDASLRELAADLGLSRADSVPNLTRRVERALPTSSALRADLRAIEKLLRTESKTKNKGEPRFGQNPKQKTKADPVLKTKADPVLTPTPFSTPLSFHARTSRGGSAARRIATRSHHRGQFGPLSSHSRSSRPALGFRHVSPLQIVMDSNMDKADENGNFIKASDGKILKSPRWRPPDAQILKEIERQQKYGGWQNFKDLD